MHFQITVDCEDPDAMARFWAEGLNYTLQPPPEPFELWRDYWISVGVPADELPLTEFFDAIIDPNGEGPRVWFQEVPESKSIKNRLHFDLLVGGGRSVPLNERKQRVHAEADRLIAVGATLTRVMDNSEMNHYAVAMQDPEGNEFDIV
ncbi:MAG: VOC family protein [Acidimicrobiia bacterium]